MTPKLLSAKEDTVHADSGYLGAAKRLEAINQNKQGKKMRCIINRRPSQIKRLSKSGQFKAHKAERQKSSIRSMDMQARISNEKRSNYSS